MNDTVTVIKLIPPDQEVWRYPGRVLARGEGLITIEAFFSKPDFPFHGLVLGKGDRFVETYFTQNWYNIFEMHDRQDDVLKGWYCNVARPAIIEKDQVSYVDLALDLLVYPDGRQLVLDEDEFLALPIDAATRTYARAALVELQCLASAGKLTRNI